MLFRVFRSFNIASDSSRKFWIFLLVFFVFPHFFFVFRPSSFILRSSSSFIFHYLDQRLQPNIVVLRRTTLVSNYRCHHKQFTILQNLMTHLSSTILAESPNYSDRFLEVMTSQELGIK